MDFNFKLLLNSKLPENGFSLDELVVATRTMFENEGMVGFLRVLLEIIDQALYLSCLGPSDHMCCERCHLVKNQKEMKTIVTSVGKLKFEWTRLKCKRCQKSYVPLKNYLNLENYQTKTNELEKIVTEIVSEQSYRRSSQHIESIGGVPIPHQRLHRWVAHSDCDQIDMKKKVQTLISDGTGFKKKPVNGSNRGEVRLVIGVTKDNLVVPYGALTEDSWAKIGRELKQANHPHPKLMFKPIAEMLVSDGEPGMVRSLKKLAKDHQRCLWHLPYELKPTLKYQDNVSDTEASNLKRELQNIIEVRLHEQDFKEVNLEDKLELEKEVFEAEQQVQNLIDSFINKGYTQAAKYLINAKKSMFSFVRTWLVTGLVNPRVSSMIERMMREIGRRIKKIGHGWSPKGAAQMTRIIIKRITSADQWNQYWCEKLKITGKIKISFLGCELEG